MKNVGNWQSKINEDTYKTKVTGQDEPKKQYKKTNTPAELKTLLTKINYTRTELTEYANERRQ